MDSAGKCCFNCGEGEKDGEVLNHLGLRWIENKDKKHILETILEHAIKLNLTYSAVVLEKNLPKNNTTFIHLPCCDKFRNQFRPKGRLETNELDLSKHPARRSHVGDFDYCEKKNVRQMFVTLIKRHLKLFPRKTQKSILVLFT